MMNFLYVIHLFIKSIGYKSLIEWHCHWFHFGANHMFWVDEKVSFVELERLCIFFHKLS